MNQSALLGDLLSQSWLMVTEPSPQRPSTRPNLLRNALIHAPTEAPR